MGSNLNRAKERTCSFCSVKFHRADSNIRGRTVVFCSLNCAAEYKKARICLADGCELPGKCKGLCQSHYDQKRKENPERKAACLQKAKESYEKQKKRRAEDPAYDEMIKQRQTESTKRQRIKHIEKLRAAGRLDARKPKRRYNKAKRGAARRGLPFTLTIDQYNEIITKACHYECGNSVSESGSGIDRVDNSRGYTPENSVPCCPICNQVKGAFIKEIEMKAFVDLLKGFRGDNVWEECKFGQRVSGRPRK